MALEVIGAGFGRTGTFSLKLALEQLGFSPCYHMLEVFSHPGHSETWQGAAEGKTVNWNSFLAGYRAGVDWPISHFWRELSVAYPQAKFILTERDPDAWYDSIAKTIIESMERDPGETDPIRLAQWKMGRFIVAEKTFNRRFDRDHVIAVYKRHNQQVKDTLPRSRLLVCDSLQGWGPLCEFLGRPVPAMPFPKTNSTEEFRARAAL
ncbi:MAG TPA: sulfotransferase [Rhizomicrobium sp.]|nr:sulfotransferase [Rhizomicrobium sp.]